MVQTQDWLELNWYPAFLVVQQACLVLALADLALIVVAAGLAEQVQTLAGLPDESVQIHQAFQ